MKLLVLICLGIGQVLACDCKSSPVSIAANEADVIFEGKVEKTIRPKLTGKLKGGYNIEEFIFSVSRFWKGDVQKSITLYNLDNDDCTQSFQQGRSYLVYSRKKRFRADSKASSAEWWGQLPGIREFGYMLTAEECSRTVQLKFAQNDLRELELRQKSSIPKK